MLVCDDCGARISKPSKRVPYFYINTVVGRKNLCDMCAYNYFDDHHVYGLLPDIAEADNENIEIPIRERVQQRSHTTD